MAKKLIINCGDCDARNVSEETLAAYESIIINAGDLLVTPETRTLLNRYGVTINCGDVLEVEKDVKITTVNGSGQIKCTDVVMEKTAANFNGSLEISPGTQAVLDSYVSITVNGPLTIPESMSGYIGKIKVNGPVICYPDDAILLKRSAVIDRLFPLRAKNKLYWAAKRMVMVDPKLDADKLVEKGATFSSKEVILAESKVEALIGLIDEKADIVVVPDGTVVIQDDVELTAVTVKKYGVQLYITGDVKVTAESEEVLRQMEYLKVCGDASVPEDLKDLLLEKAEIDGDIKTPKLRNGRLISEKMEFRVTKWMLEQETQGVCLENCLNVIIDEDIPNELILEKLSIYDCLDVKCSAQQASAVGMICEDVLSVGPGDGDGDGLGISAMIKAAMGSSENADDVKVINAGDYVL